MIKKFLPTLALALILALSWRVSQQRSLSMRFVDEDDHLAGADLITRGTKLYRELQTNHQPLVYSASAAVQKITRPNTIFLLVRRHRQAMWLYGALWSLLLVLRFSWTGLIFVLFFEWLKYGLFGNLLLAESLAVYPAVYLLSAYLTPQPPRRWELVFLGLCSFLVVFNLVPLWPWLGVIGLAYLVKLKKKIIYPIIGFLFFSLIMFSFYSPVDWFRETIYHNWLYAVPALNQVKTQADQLKLVAFPFLSFSVHDSLQAKFIALFFSSYLLAGVFKPKLLWLYPLLLLANNRVLSPASSLYEGFHLLPWLGILIWIFVYSLKFLPKYLVLGLGIWSLMLLTNHNMPYLNKTDPDFEYYVNYSPVDDFNFAVKKINWPGDRMGVTANQPLMYWQTNTQLATRQIVFYSWQSAVPELAADYQKVFSGNNPPEIIYGNSDPELLAEKYVQILKYGQPTELYLRRDKFDSITDSQWAALQIRGFSK